MDSVCRCHCENQLFLSVAVCLNVYHNLKIPYHCVPIMMYCIPLLCGVPLAAKEHLQHTC